MRMMAIAVCVQIHAEPQGFACDDHVDKTCYTIRLSDPEIETKIIKRIAELTEKSEKSLDDRTKAWVEKHPEAEECTAEGDEFVGHMWIEASNYVDGRDVPDPGDKSDAEFLEILNSIEIS